MEQFNIKCMQMKMLGKMCPNFIRVLSDLFEGFETWRNESFIKMVKDQVYFSIACNVTLIFNGKLGRDPGKCYPLMKDLKKIIWKDQKVK